jgi:hypothetical protein
MRPNVERGPAWFARLLSDAVRFMAEGHHRTPDALLRKKASRKGGFFLCVQFTEEIRDRLETRNDFPTPSIFIFLTSTAHQA